MNRFFRAAIDERVELMKKRRKERKDMFFRNKGRRKERRGKRKGKEKRV